MLSFRIVAVSILLSFLPCSASASDEVTRYIVNLETALEMANDAVRESQETTKLAEEVQPSGLDRARYTKAVEEFQQAIGMLAEQLDKLKSEPNEAIWIITTMGALHVLDGKGDNIRSLVHTEVSMLSAFKKLPLHQQLFSALRERFDLLGEQIWRTVPIAMLAGDESLRAKQKGADHLLDECRTELEKKGPR